MAGVRTYARACARPFVRVSPPSLHAALNGRTHRGPMTAELCGEAVTRRPPSGEGVCVRACMCGPMTAVRRSSAAKGEGASVSLNLSHFLPRVWARGRAGARMCLSRKRPPPGERSRRRPAGRAVPPGDVCAECIPLPAASCPQGRCPVHVSLSFPPMHEPGGKRLTDRQSGRSWQVCLSVCLSVRLSVCLSVSLSLPPMMLTGLCSGAQPDASRIFPMSWRKKGVGGARNVV